MIIKFKTKEQMIKFFNQYEIKDEELLSITLLLDDDMMLKEESSSH